MKLMSRQRLLAEPTLSAGRRAALRTLTSLLTLGAAMLCANLSHAAPTYSGHAAVDGFNACPESFFRGHAPVPPQGDSRPGKLRALCFNGFAVMHSGESKTPVYVAEFMDRQSLKAAKKIPRTDRFYEEARLPSSERASLADYRGSQMHRGHMFAAANAATPEAMAQSFSLANIVPQAPRNNSGAWSKQVESTTRKYAQRSAEGIYVLTGPIYAGIVRTIGRGKVWVPSALFKLVYDPSTARAWAYVVDNSDDAKVGRPVSYDSLVERLGMHLLPPDAVKAPDR